MTYAKPKTYRLYPGTELKLRLLSLHLRLPMTRIIENLVDEYWAKFENKPVTPNMGSKRAQRLFRNLDISLFEDLQ